MKPEIFTGVNISLRQLNFGDKGRVNSSSSPSLLPFYFRAFKAYQNGAVVGRKLITEKTRHFGNDADSKSFSP